MAAIRLLRISNPLVLSKYDISKPTTVMMCLNRTGQCSENPPGERKPVAVKASRYSPSSLVVSEPKTDGWLDLNLVFENVSDAMKFISKPRPWRFHFQMYIEKAIIDCRFFTLLAIAGSLLGSVLCFVEGCFLILDTYLQSFHALSQQSEQGHHLMFQLIESIDMFLVGTAMLIFGMSLHVMFVGSQHIKANASQKSHYFEKLQSWMGMNSVMQAKSKIGHAVIMILQVEILEKFKSIPMTNGLDLACFAGVVFLSSASIFLLSRINVAPAETSCCSSETFPMG